MSRVENNIQGIGRAIWLEYGLKEWGARAVFDITEDYQKGFGFYPKIEIKTNDCLSCHINF